jgi:hypothetical protein
MSGNLTRKSTLTARGDKNYQVQDHETSIAGEFSTLDEAQRFVRDNRASGKWILEIEVVARWLYDGRDFQRA